MPRITLELLDDQARHIEGLIDELLVHHSGVRVFRNDPRSDMVIIGFTNSWEKLEQPGRQLQSRILRDLERYEPFVKMLLRGAPENARREAEEASETIREAVDQSKGTYRQRPEQVIEEVREAFAKHREHLGSLYDPAPGEHVYVPDANAIIWNPDLEDWTFPDSPRFSVVLTSTLLGELDSLKMPSRGDSVREKAQGAIRRIKEYGRRGDIHAGVTLRRDRSTVRMTAAEPDFENTLPWFDPAVKDDRLLAACLEVVGEHPHSPVVLVTLDANMQNKARYAGIPFVEPPDPPAGAADEQRRRRRGPRPDIRILELKATGGSTHGVNFAALIQNYGAQPVRATLAATVESELMILQPDTLDLLVNTDPSLVSIVVSRPERGELVPEFANETTLFGAELVLEVKVDEECVAAEKWREVVYDAGAEPQRHAIQQRYWRAARGEATAQDLRMERIEKYNEQQERDLRRGPIKRTPKWYDDETDIGNRRF